MTTASQVTASFLHFNNFSIGFQFNFMWHVPDYFSRRVRRYLMIIVM